MKTRNWLLAITVLAMTAGAWGCSDDAVANVWCDDASGLCWQDPPFSGDATYGRDSAVSYCDNLVHGGYSDWRLPDIDELITLFRGCVNGTATGDLSPSTCVMTPAGCVAMDSCDGVSNCDWCPGGSGPGAGGCYWDPALSGPCAWCWSSSPYDSVFAWVVAFDLGSVYYDFVDGDYSVRCVRAGP